mmetsp:Transcript_4293/g.8335  ORF Transcript_4293/g.8335 Transcript_4293/m.8335 type:complete len:127 (-) Transcript_4293:345-725(-)
MKFSVLSTILAVAPLASVEAFAPAPFGVIARSMTAQSSSATAIFSDKKDEEDSGGLDLDLGEMFDMFDAGKSMSSLILNCCFLPHPYGFFDSSSPLSPFVRFISAILRFYTLFSNSFYPDTVSFHS